MKNHLFRLSPVCVDFILIIKIMTVDNDNIVHYPSVKVMNDFINTPLVIILISNVFMNKRDI